MEKRKCVCFAYFGDGKFIGWYADSFGSIREYSPKLYGYRPEQVEIVRKNFSRKFYEENFATQAAKRVSAANELAGALIEAGDVYDKGILSNYKEVELRVVECPIYDGPNPDFDKEAHEKLMAAWLEEFNKNDFAKLPAGRERYDKVKEYETEHPSPKADNWIYCDYTQVQEWAKNEPTVFLEVVKPIPFAEA